MGVTYYNILFVSYRLLLLLLEYYLALILNMCFNTYITYLSLLYEFNDYLNVISCINKIKENL